MPTEDETTNLHGQGEPPDETSRHHGLRKIWEDLARQQSWRLTDHEVEAAGDPSYIPETLSQADARDLARELEAVRNAAYVESEEQIAGWNYEKGEGGVAFHELPIGDREVMIETYIDWSKYMERGMTFKDQGRIMFHGAREVRNGYSREQDAPAGGQQAEHDHELDI